MRQKVAELNYPVSGKQNFCTIHVAPVDLTHEFSATPARRNNRSIAQDSYDSPDGLFTVGYHGSNCTVFRTESDTPAYINAYPNMQIIFVGEQGATHVSYGEAMGNLSRIDDRLSVLN